jgi:hypothetical protein
MAHLTKGILKKVICTEKVYGSLERETYMREVILWTKNMDLANIFGRMGRNMKGCLLMAINQQAKI